MISFSHVSKEYVKGKKILNDITLDIKEGEMVFLIGPTGAGKSTIINLITRAQKISDGIISFYDKNEGKRKNIYLYRPEVYRRKLGIVFQDYKLVSYKTAEENIAFPLEFLGEDSRTIRKRTIEVMQMVDIDNLKGKYPDEMSGGEKQKVGIARALVNNPQLILADEPTGNLDFRTTEDIMHLLSKINRMGTTIIMVTHDHEAVKCIGGRIIQLNKGRIIKDINPYR